MRRYYTTLEVPYDAPFEQVKQAYRDLVRVWHPDKYARHERLQKLATEKLTAINEAYTFIRALHAQNFIEDDPVVEGEPIDWSRRKTPRQQNELTAKEKTERYKPFIVWRWYREAVGVSALVALMLISSFAVSFAQKKESEATRKANIQLQQLLGFHVPQEGGTFSVGSTKEDVLILQGVPTQEILKYGESEVILEGGKVKSWKNVEANPLATPPQK